MNQHQKKDMNKINFAFWGTPELSAHTLDMLFEGGYMPKVIVTTPDQRSGRGMHTSATAVAIWAEKHNVTCLKPDKIDNDFMEEFNKFNIDLSIVVAYGKILPEVFIKMPKLGTINVHYSLLPKYRGASPVEQALLNGDTMTGVCIQQMEYKLDSGAIISETETPINIDDTKNTLLERLTDIGGKMLCEILPKIIEGKTNPKIQNENSATYCSKIKKKDGLIDINGNAKENYNKYRSFAGWPGIYFFIKRNGKDMRVKITGAKYEHDSFVIERVVPEGRKEISYSNFLKSNILK
jgi:methionyl-tRNA formyltransferase